jgi:UDP-N-acetylmuramyl tripeptide synthase
MEQQMPVIEWFAYAGPNRRSDRKVVEVTLKFGPADQNAFPTSSNEIKRLLVEGGILAEVEHFPGETLPGERMAWYSSLLMQTALLFQQKAGHRVSFTSVSVCSGKQLCIALVEHQHIDVGMTAVKLAIELLTGKRRLLAEPFRMFREFALQRRLPVETEAIIHAAVERDIPCIQLEQNPYKREDFSDLSGGACIRKNGLLMLGHGKFQRVLEGTFPLDGPEFLKDLLRDRDRRRALLDQLEIPVAQPVTAAGAPAAQFHLVVVNGEVTTLTGPPHVAPPCLDDVHTTYVKYALDINREVGLAPVAVTISSEDISKSPQGAGDGVLDFVLAPKLESFTAKQAGGVPGGLQISANAIVEWLFPGRCTARLPIIAVTGTNGKTTTTRMINHVMTFAGRRPGMVCTDGVFIDGEVVEEGDACMDVGHFKVLTSKEVDIAVLETHHAGIMSRGFAFQWCDIAICLNVSEDHLGVGNVNTVEDMAAVKQALPERARHAAILNADDPFCMAMLKAVKAEKVCLVSMELPFADLAVRAAGRKACFCVLEAVDSKEWLVIHDDGKRLPVIPVDGIPATFNGMARFNVSNAMHTAVACYLAGVDVNSLGQALQCFTSGYDTTPGRMNEFDDLPFRIIMDFAHNPDGFRNVAEFVDRQSVNGRKMVVFAGTGDRTDETLEKMSAELAGHFDFYFCKEHLRLEDANERKRRPVAKIMQKGLLDAGVPESRTAVLMHGEEVIFSIFDACHPGDLLIMLLGHVEKHLLAGYISKYIRQGT